MVEGLPHDEDGAVSVLQRMAFLPLSKGPVGLLRFLCAMKFVHSYF